jgi:hypothetical protein
MDTVTKFSPSAPSEPSFNAHAYVAKFFFIPSASEPLSRVSDRMGFVSFGFRYRIPVTVSLSWAVILEDRASDIR